MKKLSNRLSVKQSSTKEGQRELLREHTNAINELIDIINEMQGMKPYTAMRSTGGLFSGGDKKYCECDEPLTDSVYWKDKCFYCNRPIKPQEDVREKILEEIHKWQCDLTHDINADELTDRILAIVKGE